MWTNQNASLTINTSLLIIILFVKVAHHESEVTENGEENSINVEENGINKDVSVKLEQHDFWPLPLTIHTAR